MKFIVGISLALMILSGCSSRKTAEKEIEEKAAQTPVHDSQELGGTIQHAIDSSTLPEMKKEQLRSIMAMNKQKAQALSTKSYQFRALLIEELLGSKPNARKVSILKRDIKITEDEKLKNTFETIEKISTIVSDHPEKQKFSEHLMNIDRGH